MMIALPNNDGSFTCTLFVPHDGKDSINHRQTENDVIKYMMNHFADIVAFMPDMTSVFLKNPNSSLVTVRCFPWVNGRTALIGDACHAIVPFYGQGMNCGFEDVRVLDELIDENENDWDKIYIVTLILSEPLAVHKILRIKQWIESKKECLICIKKINIDPDIKGGMIVNFDCGAQIDASYNRKFEFLYKT